MTPATTINAIRSMRANGGDFVRALAQAWLSADPDNRGRIEAAFPDVFARYSNPPAEVRA